MNPLLFDHLKKLKRPNIKNLDFKGELNVEKSFVNERKENSVSGFSVSRIEEQIKKLAIKGVFPEIGNRINAYRVICIRFYVGEKDRFTFYIELEEEED